MVLNKTRANSLLQKIFIKNYLIIKYCKITRKGNKGKNSKILELVVCLFAHFIYCFHPQMLKNSIIKTFFWAFP